MLDFNRFLGIPREEDVRGRRQGSFPEQRLVTEPINLRMVSSVSGRFARRTVRPDQVDSPQAYLSFFKPEKENKRGKTMTAHGKSKSNKMTSQKLCSPCCRVLYVIGQMSWRTPSGQSTFGRYDRTSFRQRVVLPLSS